MELRSWLEERREPIESGKLAVFFQDECHLLWGNVCGYVWGKTDERVEVPVQNQKERQTYFGGVNLATGKCLIQPHPTGNGLYTVEYLNYLSGNAKLFIEVESTNNPLNRLFQSRQYLINFAQALNVPVSSFRCNHRSMVFRLITDVKDFAHLAFSSPI